MLIEKQDAINTLEIMRNSYKRAGLSEAANAITLAIGQIEKVKETPPTFYLIDNQKKEAREFEGVVINASSDGNTRYGLEGGA